MISKFKWIFIVPMIILLTQSNYNIDKNYYDTTDETYISFMNNTKEDNSTDEKPKFDPLAKLDFAEIDYGDLNGSKGRIYKDDSTGEEIWYGLIELTEEPIATLETVQHSYDYDWFKDLYMPGFGYHSTSKSYTWDFNFDRDIKQLTEINIEYETESYCDGNDFLICFGTKVKAQNGILNINLENNFLNEKYDAENDDHKETILEKYLYYRTDSNSFKLMSPSFDTEGLFFGIEYSKTLGDLNKIHPTKTTSKVSSYKYILENNEVDDILSTISKQLKLEEDYLKEEAAKESWTNSYLNYRQAQLKSAYEYYSIDYDEEILSVCTENCLFSEFSITLFDFIKSVFIMIIILVVILFILKFTIPFAPIFGSLFGSILKFIISVLKRYRGISIILLAWILADIFIDTDLIIIRILSNIRIDLFEYMIDKNVLIKAFNELVNEIFGEVEIITTFLEQEAI